MAQFAEFVTNHWMLSLSFVVILAILVGGELRHRIYGLKSIDPQSAIRIMNQSNAVLLDVREEKEISDGWAANAVRVPLSRLKQEPKELESYRERPLIAYCGTGQRSEQACALLRKQGHEDVYNLAGGLNAWRNANLPVYRS